MKFTVLSLFPDFFLSPLKQSILKRSINSGIISIDCIDIRDFANNKNHSVDDSPFGGGDGMIMNAEPVALSIENIKKYDENTEVIFFTPSGDSLTQEKTNCFAKNNKNKILLCGHYEGIDERVLNSHVDHFISVGSSVLTGGEIPALFFLDSVNRILPNSINKKSSHEKETFSTKLYGKGEYPQFTRPSIWRNKKVPAVLLSGNHKKIEDYEYGNLKNCSNIEKKIIFLKRTYFDPKKPYKLKNYKLRIPIQNDILDWYKWFEDKEIYKYLNQENLSLENIEKFFIKQNNNLFLLKLEIVEKTTNYHIGTISLYIKKHGKIGKLSIVMGNHKDWNSGVVTSILKELILIYKNLLNLEKITLVIFTKNIAAQKIYEKCGFTKVGKSTKAVLKNNVWHDTLFYEYLF
jgi:tRNA (guanine37-N1)-methyltransferase